MKKETFEGTSTNGSIEEAVAKAIVLAKNKLKVDFLVWNLDSLVGANGGLVYSNIVTVSIKAKGVNLKKLKEKEAKANKIKEAKDKKLKGKGKKVKLKVEKLKELKPIADTIKTKVAVTTKPKVAPAKKVAPKKVAPKKAAPKK